MILRRVTSHVKEQNWFAVILDFFMVVTGILMALQITNWNEERVDRQRAAAYLDMLQTDFTVIIERLDSNLAAIDDSINNIAYVREVLKTKPELPNAEVDRFRAALDTIDSTRIPGGRSATFIEMQSSGELNLITDSELKKSLLTYDQRTEIAHSGWNSLQTTITEIIEPVLYHQIEYAPTAGATPAQNSVVVQSFNYERMHNEADFKAALSALSRVQHNLYILQTSQRGMAQDVLQRLTNPTGQ
jgi:hypothetical protein